MGMMSKIIFTADLHGDNGLYDQLFDLGHKEKATALLIGGDMLPKEGDFFKLFDQQKKFIRRHLKSVLKKNARRNPSIPVYAMLGNDDWAGNLPYLRELETQGLLFIVHGKKFSLPGGFELIGYGNVPPTPFIIKDWERIDLPEVSLEDQYPTAFLSDPKGMKPIKTLAYFQGQKTLGEELNDLPIPYSYQKTIYAFHAPPFQTKLDHLYDGRPIGSRAIRRFIEKHQPFLTLHGHIHESPYLSGSYLDRIGKTLCVNPGQMGNTLHAVILDLDRPEETIRHTVLG
jgi:Icc-related predicted phosphoesterase